ncbi:BglG family transcription antiterminator [Thermosediminibacter litoriperuensis]|uniref:BglG family transcription antiterminator n=1 Tax=Thermosediminibacter litoriperuensis TaxID=291989 RepID=UPI00147837F5|nr:BglG family transcription antiterminator [Thermosediminibacter litoriperuensis]
MDLTRREREILKILLEGPTTAERLASLLGVSRRTILRDLPGLSEKLKSLGITLERKAGIGISLEGRSESMEKLGWLLERPSKKVEMTPGERQQLIILSLLEQKGPRKLYTFAREFDVTEATVSNDLDRIEEILSRYGIKLLRRPGLGVWIEGQEKNIRALVTDLFYENFDETQLVRLIRDNLRGGIIPGGVTAQVKNRLLGLIDRNLVEGIEHALKEAIEESGIHLADSAYAGLLVHIALALERLKSGETISMDEAFLANLKKTKEFELAARLGSKLESAFGISIPEGELGYITMHLLGAKLRMGDNLHELFVLDHREVAGAAREILKEAGRELKRDLLEDGRVLEDLALHLKPALVRLKLGMEIRNPLLSQIKETYPRLMQVARRAARLLEKRFRVPVPESEIGYIAMHIGAALERGRGKERAGVVLVCPSGIGSARMLASRIKKELPELEILDVVSVLDLEKSLEKHPAAEAVISTVPLEVAEPPVLLVSPLLNDEDVENIRAHFKERRLKERENDGVVAGRGKPEERRELVFEILEDFAIEEVGAGDLEELLDAVVEKIERKPGITSAGRVKKDLHSREVNAGTAVPGLGLSVLHARTGGVEKPFLGLFRLKEPLKMRNMDGDTEEVRACLVMLLPQEPSAGEIEVMGRISAGLVEDRTLAGILKDGSSGDVIKALLRILK